MSVSDEHDAPVPFGVAPGRLCPSVIFSKLRDHQGALFWARRWTHHRALLAPAFDRIEAQLRALGRSDLCLSVAYAAEHGHIFRFDDTLFRSERIIHYWDRQAFFSEDECAAIERLGAIEISGFGPHPLRLREVCDFQICRDPAGRLIYLDFEPAPRLALDASSFRKALEELLAVTWPESFGYRRGSP